jgi:nicotinamidase-related amidase
LLLIDVINDLEFEGAEKLVEHARIMAEHLVALKKRAKAAGVPVVYINDNFGRWRSNFHAQIKHCLEDGVRGKDGVERLRPDEEDYFVLKPKHSAFFSTTLEILLDHLGANTLIITGIATNICVLFTANDAYMRDYSLFIPRDCVAANTEEDNHYALEQMRTVLKADVRQSTEIDFESPRSAF